MDLGRYPLKTATDDELLTRLNEECGETIQAICKIQRFGWGIENVAEALMELSDVLEVAEEFRLRCEDKHPIITEERGKLDEATEEAPREGMAGRSP